MLTNNRWGFNIDAIRTNIDTNRTYCDAIRTYSDAIRTNSDTIRTYCDAIRTNSDTIRTYSDAIRTYSDAIITNSDVIRTNSDAIRTNSDAIRTNRVVELLGFCFMTQTYLKHFLFFTIYTGYSSIVLPLYVIIHCNEVTKCTSHLIIHVYINKYNPRTLYH